MNEDGFAAGVVAGQNGNGFGNGAGMWGMEWMWVILLFAMWGGGWGGNWGGGNMNGALTRSDLCQDMNFNNLEGAVRGVQQGLCDGFYAQNTTMLQGFNGIQQEIANCCCQTQRAIDNVNYNMAKNTCDIIQAGHNDTQRLYDLIKDQENNRIREELQTYKLAASQAQQNAFFQANQEAQTAELIRRLGTPSPVPAWIVQNPNCCNNPYIAYPGNGNCCNGGC